MHVTGKRQYLQYHDIFIPHVCNIYQTRKKRFYLVLRLLSRPMKITSGYEKK